MIPFLTGFTALYLLSALIVTRHRGKLQQEIQKYGAYTPGVWYAMLFTPVFNSLLAVVLTWLAQLERRRRNDRNIFLEAAYRLEEFANSNRIASGEQRKILMDTADYLKQMANERRTD